MRRGRRMAVVMCLVAMGVGCGGDDPEPVATSKQLTLKQRGDQLANTMRQLSDAMDFGCLGAARIDRLRDRMVAQAQGLARVERLVAPLDAQIDELLQSC